LCDVSGSVFVEYKAAGQSLNKAGVLKKTVGLHDSSWRCAGIVRMQSGYQYDHTADGKKGSGFRVPVYWVRTSGLGSGTPSWPQDLRVTAP
jgi:hypothetical protein